MQSSQQGGGGTSLIPEALAVPSLKVMRLQKPELDTPPAGITLDLSRCMLGTALCLPDSFGVIHVGETFTAYLGAINTNKALPVTKLTVTAQLQTPTQRWHLASRLDEGNMAGGVDVPPESGVDTIVSHALEEPGQHILRVEVGYGAMDGTTKTIRKFYRFACLPLGDISTKTYRTGDMSCFVSVSFQNNGETPKQGLTLSSAQFEPGPGLVAEPVLPLSKSTMRMATSTKPVQDSSDLRALDLFDKCGRLEPGGASRNYLFKVTAQPSVEGCTKGIAVGDELGRAVFTWRKACGEMGRIASTTVFCPAVDCTLNPNNPEATMRGENSDYVVHVQGSCLSVDVAAMAAARAAGQSSKFTNDNSGTLDLLLPVTVEPIDPPKKMSLRVPSLIKFLIVNHSEKYLSLQLQFRSEHMKGLSVCGPSYKNLEEIAGNGGSAVAEMHFMALTPGLLKLCGCCMVDLATDLLIPQPPLFYTFVENDAG